jgi:GGDEF domain-containing protein
MILKTNISCINEIRENIRKTDLVFKMPIENYYIIILQHTNITTAIQVGSRISSLIKREFMLKKEITYHQMALISVESKVKIKDVIYEILTSIDKNKLDKNEKDLWKKIKKL